MWIFYIIMAVVLAVGTIISLVAAIRTVIRNGGFGNEVAACLGYGTFAIGITISGGVVVVLCYIALCLMGLGII